MSLVTRTEKGSKLTIEEMDANLATLRDLTTQEGDSIFVPEFKQNFGINQVGGINTSVLQPDRKLVVAGNFGQSGTSYGTATTVTRVFRLETDGLPDLEFTKNVGSGFNAVVWDSAIQNDGKLIFTGQFTTFNGTSSPGIIRLNTDGSIDGSFVVTSGFNNGGPDRVTLDPVTGKLYVAGGFTTWNGVSVPKLVRLNTDGSLDETFDVGTGPAGSCSVAVLPNGKIFLFGDVSTFNGESYNNTLLLNQDGSVDESFTSLSITYSIISYREPLVMSSGKIVVFGQITAPTSGIVVINPDGTLDTGFNTGTGFEGPAPFGQSYAPTFISHVIEDNGKLLVNGTPWIYNGTIFPKLMRLNMDGSIDTTFNVGKGLIDSGYCTLNKNNDEYLIVGIFIAFNGRLMRGVARLKAQP